MVWRVTHKYLTKSFRGRPLSSVMYAFFAQELDGVTVENGNVSIGTSSPQEKLDVNGGIRLANYLRFNGPLTTIAAVSR